MTQIIRQEVGEKLADSFMNYAMYVITNRALPDIRDGLKPVQRRVLYSMAGLNLTYNKAPKKSARVVGDCLGKYHPHGDTSVYHAMVNMAQDFSMRYPLVDGQGNFGSVDGDSPAAMRYTEARMSRIGELMLHDLNKETVVLKQTFDDSDTEPTVLPTMFPNLLANGSTGIAVSMATSIPPHNANALYEACELMVQHAIDGEETTIDELIRIVKAPDFPTGGQLINQDQVIEAYKTGRGRALIRSKYTIVENNGAEQILVSEIPFKVNKASLVQQIDALRKTVPDIKEVRDESNKDGIQIAIDLKKGANSQWIIKRLLKHTAMQSSFSMNMVALANGEPIQFTLMDALEHFLAHVSDVITRRSLFDLNKARRREHIVTGILSCIDNIDNVIATIKKSKTSAEIQSNLMNDFSLSEEQAKAISEMKLRSVSQISLDDYKEEHEKLTGDIEKYRGIVNDQSLLLQQVLTEISAMKTMFSPERMTEIVHTTQTNFSDRELVESEDLIITLTKNGIIKSVLTSEYRSAGRATKGVKSSSIKDDDAIEFVFNLNSRDDLMFFTNTGRCHVLEAYKVPTSSRKQAGKYLTNFLSLEGDEEIMQVITRNIKEDNGDLLFITKQGMTKRLSMSDLSSVRTITKVINFKEEDSIVSVHLIQDQEETIAFTALGQAVRFKPNSETSPVRVMGRSAVGVKAIRLVEGDFVVASTVVDDTKHLLLATENGLGKRVKFDLFSTLNRGAKGVVSMKVNERSGILVSALTVDEDDDIFMVTEEGVLNRISASTVSVMGRTAQGVKMINLNGGDSLISVSRSEKEEDIEEELEAEEGEE